MNEDLLMDIYQSTTEKESANQLMSDLSLTEGRYTELTKISSGGMKSIFRCNDTRTDRDIVLMTPKKESLNKLFIREARINAFLQHPNIAPIYDIGLIEENKPFFTSKLIRGKALSELKFSGQTEKCVDIVIKICEAISYAHSHSIVHQDLKPENVMIDDFGEVVLIDWGLAEIDDSLMKGESSILDKDLESLLLYSIPEEYRKLRGTPGFISPERYERNSVSTNNDIYSIGGLLFNLLTGVVPSQPKTSGFKASLEFSDESISPGLKAICQKALSTKKGDRYGTVKEMLEDLIRYRQGFATNAESASPLRLLKLLYHRNRQFCIVSFLSLSIIVIIITVSFIMINTSKNTAIKEQAKAEQANSKNLELLEELKKKEISRQEFMKLNASNQLFILKDMMQQKQFNHVPKLLKFTESLDSENEEIQTFRADYELATLNLAKAKEIYQNTGNNEGVKIIDLINPNDGKSILEQMNRISTIVSKDVGFLLTINALQKFKDLKIQEGFYRWNVFFNHQGMKYMPSVSITERDGKVTLAIKDQIVIRYAGPVELIDPHIIDFSNTNIHSLQGVTRCKHIEEMNLSNISIVSFGKFIYPSVKKLNISETGIKNIVPTTFPNLEVFDISGAAYKQYSRFKKYPKLKELIVDKDKYKEIEKNSNFKITVKE